MRVARIVKWGWDMKEKCQASIIDVRWEQGNEGKRRNKIKLIIMNEGPLLFPEKVAIMTFHPPCMLLCTIFNASRASFPLSPSHLTVSTLFTDRIRFFVLVDKKQQRKTKIMRKRTFNCF